jgi:hypothetical protein
MTIDLLMEPCTYQVVYVTYMLFFDVIIDRY